MQIQDRREIQPLTKQAELCYIGDPLLIWLFSIEIPIQQIGHNFAHFSLIRTVFLHSDTANQPQVFHKSLDRLVIQVKSTVAQFYRDTAIAIPASVFMINSSNFCFGCLVFVTVSHPLQMVVKGSPRQLSDCEQKGQREFLP